MATTKRQLSLGVEGFLPTCLASTRLETTAQPDTGVPGAPYRSLRKASQGPAPALQPCLHLREPLQVASSRGAWSACSRRRCTPRRRWDGVSMPHAVERPDPRKLSGKFGQELPKTEGKNLILLGEYQLYSKVSQQISNLNLVHIKTNRHYENVITA